MQSSDPKWNDRFVKIAMHAYRESVEDLEPLVTWGQSVLSATDTSNPPLDAKMLLMQQFSFVLMFLPYY